MDRKPVILILCTGNSCRSQMAEGFLRQVRGSQFDIHSAGMDPKPAVHPLAVRVMAEVGIDIGHNKPTALREYLGRLPVRHVLIVCDRANHTCPRIWPGSVSRTYLPFDDPALAEGTDQEKLAVFRRVRDEIGEAMKEWRPEVHE